MKISYLLFFMTVISAFASGSYSQSVKINLAYEDVPLQTVFSAIEDQSEFFFLYSSKIIDIDRKVDITADNESITSVLNDLFDGTEVKYDIKDRQILLMNKNSNLIGLAQQMVVTGTIVDGNGESLPGVNVTVVGTTVGVISDMNGHYSIDVPNASSILQFSFIGFTSQEITVGNQSIINVTMAEDSQILEEVVVVGYGVQRKSDLTGAITSVKSDELQNRAVDNVAQTIQGKVSGVQILYNSGAPGSSAAIRVRGFSSNSTSEADMNPLYIVDGLQVSSIDHIDSENIESMEILKDAASAAIYGAQAGNGVVLITTKTGSKGNGRIFYNFSQAYTNTNTLPTNMNADQWIDFVTEAGWVTPSLIDQYYDGVTDTKWADYAFETGSITHHVFGMEGGTDKASYYSSISYNYNDGVVITNKDSYKRLTFQLNAEYKINSWLTVGTNNSFENSITKNVSENDTKNSLMGTVNSLDPLTPYVYLDESNLPAHVQSEIDNGHGDDMLRNPDGYLYGISYWSTNENYVPDIMLNLTEGSSKRQNLNGTMYLNVTPIKDFTFTSRFGYTIGSSSSDEFAKSHWINSTHYQQYASINATISNSTYYQWENFANYSKSFDKHNFTLMAGMSYKSNLSNYLSVSADRMLNEDYDNYHYPSYYDAANAIDSFSGEPSQSMSLAYYGRLTYNYANKYNATVNFRADAFDSSKLDKSSRWGYFPSASVGWTINNEDFFSSVNKKVISLLKVRASYGINGNINVLSGYPYTTTLSSSGYFTFNETTVQGIAPSTTLSNLDLQWEKSKQVDIGVDMRFLNDRLSATIDYYNKNTEGLLIRSSAPYVSGCSYQYQNAGNVLNTGTEYELSWKDNVGGFGYSISGNLSTIKNIVTKGPSTSRISGRGPFGGETVTYFEEGYPVWYFRGYVTDHIDSETGEIVYKTSEELGTDDGRDYIGSGIPDFTYGMTVNMSYKNFDLTLFGTGSQGNEMFMALYRCDQFLNNRNILFYNERWTPTNTDASRPSALYMGNTTYWCSDQLVFDGSYFKIKQIQLGYNIPSKLLKKLKISSLRVYSSLEDYFTFTKYPGMDPETQASTTSGLGFDYGAYPTTKKFSFGANVVF